MMPCATRAAIARFLSPPLHTGIAASWCPVCGKCTCPRHDDGSRVFGVDGTVWSEACPLHGAAGKHAEGPVEP